MKLKLDTIAKIYEGQGRCLICLKEFDAVHQSTDEHIVPRCLSKTGEMYIRKGTCSVCNSGMNERFENYVFQNELVVPRAKLHLKRKNKKKPINLPMMASGEVKKN